MYTKDDLRAMAEEMGFELRQRDFYYRPFEPPARGIGRAAEESRGRPG
jgi:2-iminoacetate synthase ThiH